MGKEKINNEWYSILPDLPEPISDKSTHHSSYNKSITPSCTLNTPIVINVNNSGAVETGDGTSRSSTSEDEGGGEDEENKQGLKHLVLKPLLDKVTDLFVNIMAIIIATMLLKWSGFL